MPEFLDLRAALLEYRHAGAGRLPMLMALRKKITELPPAEAVTEVGLACEIFKEMAYAATMLNYAETLYRIENQHFFDILIDFKMPDIFENPAFSALKDYFEFHPTAPQMRLLKPLDPAIYTPDLWNLFREAQKAKLISVHKLERFNLDELNTAVNHPEQLYPLNIQMMGKLENHAVDRVVARPDGTYRLAHRFGSYLLPGGGMVEINLAKSGDKLLGKMLDEHLEEEHGSLFEEAAPLFDAMSPVDFAKQLTETIETTKTLEGGLKAALLEIVGSGLTNAGKLKEMLACLEGALVEAKAANHQDQIKTLCELMASIQVGTFKLTPTYQAAFEYLKSHTTMVQIEQFGDVRACGGVQISNSFIMTGEPLEEWFAKHLPHPKKDCHLADDLQGGVIHHLSLLQAVEQFDKVKFSHLLILLQCQLLALTTGTLKQDKAWDAAQYVKAQASLIAGVEKLFAKIGPPSVAAVRFFAQCGGEAEGALSAETQMHGPGSNL